MRADFANPGSSTSWTEVLPSIYRGDLATAMGNKKFIKDLKIWVLYWVILCVNLTQAGVITEKGGSLEEKLL